MVDSVISVLFSISNLEFIFISTGSSVFVMEQASFLSRVRNRCFQRQPVSEQFVDT